MPAGRSGKVAVLPSAANPFMSLYHPKQYKVSFAARPKRRDISDDRLEIGAENVRFDPRIDDKSSWTWPFLATGRDRPCLARALRDAARAFQMVRAGPARHRRVLRRRRL